MTRWQFFWMKYFNPRSLTGSDAKAVMDIYTEEIFQSTLPHRERRTSDKGRPGYSYFNPRSLTGSDPAHFPEAEDPVHFNPRSLTGSDSVEEAMSGKCHISIHAPSPGATTNYNFSCRRRSFQSTLPHRERQQNPLIFLPFPSLFLRNYTVSILTIQSHSSKPPHNFPSYFPISSANPSGDLWVLGIRTGAFRVCVFRQNAVPYR